MRICILTPGPLGSDPRVVKEADAFAGAGHRVTTISTRTLAEVDRFDDAVLLEASWEAQRLDFRSRGNRWRIRRAIQQAQEGAFVVSGFGQFADRSISPFTPGLISAAKRIVADLYVAHYPGALPAAAMAARTHKARYAYDAEDFHLGDWPDGAAHETKRQLLRAVEGRYLPNCAYVTAASPGIADAYVEAYGIARPAVVLNVFPRAEAPQAIRPSGKITPGPSIYWFSQTIGPNRGLETAVEAIGRGRARPHLYLRGSGAAGFIDRLRSIAVKVGAEDRLHILAPELPHEMVRLAGAYDIGLSSETGYTLNRRIALNNKVFTYLLAGIPVLLSDIPAHRSFATSAGHAARLYAVENPDALAEAIDALLGDSKILADARAAAFQLGQTRFNWENQKITLFDCVAAITAPQRADSRRTDYLEQEARGRVS